MSRMRSMPTAPMSSRRPRNGLMYVAPAFAESSACGAEKQSVWFTRMPLPDRYFTALSPSLVSGHLTTAFGAICASSSPSFTMPSKSTATTSRLTSPGTIEQISSTSGRKGFFSLAMRDGFVVTPSTTPIATPSLISETFAVSRKIFIGSPLVLFEFDLRTRPHRGEDGGVSRHAAEHVHATGGTGLGARAGRRASEENAEGVTR